MSTAGLPWSVAYRGEVCADPGDARAVLKNFDDQEAADFLRLTLAKGRAAGYLLAPCSAVLGAAAYL